MIEKHLNQRGQILLTTLLVLSLATTVVLALIGRSVTDVSLSSQVEESAKALNAAEAGIEESLLSGGNALGSAGGAAYSSTVTTIGGASSVYQFSKKTSVDATETLWLVPHASGVMDESNPYRGLSLDICWSDAAVKPALLVSIWYKRDSEYRVARGAYDPDTTRRVSSNNFAGVDATSGGCGGGSATIYKKTITFSNFDNINTSSDTLLFLRLQPIYNGATIAVSPVSSSSLPSQGNKIDSIGSVGSGVTRKVVVYQQFKSPAPIFDHVLYSQETLSQ